MGTGLLPGLRFRCGAPETLANRTPILLLPGHWNEDFKGKSLQLGGEGEAQGRCTPGLLLVVPMGQGTGTESPVGSSGFGGGVH